MHNYLKIFLVSIFLQQPLSFVFSQQMRDIDVRQLSWRSDSLEELMFKRRFTKEKENFYMFRFCRHRINEGEGIYNIYQYQLSGYNEGIQTLILDEKMSVIFKQTFLCPEADCESFPYDIAFTDLNYDGSAELIERKYYTGDDRTTLICSSINWSTGGKDTLFEFLAGEILYFNDSLYEIKNVNITQIDFLKANQRFELIKIDNSVINDPERDVKRGYRLDKLGNYTFPVLLVDRISNIIGETKEIRFSPLIFK